jgi:hypothetical protein
MHISGLQHREINEYREVSGEIGKFHLWFRFPARFRTDERDASSLVTAALLPAMLLGEDVVLDEDYFMSALLHAHLDKVQEIYNHWNPIFKRIKIKARTQALTGNGAGTGSFFSGGVDGTYTLCRHRDEIEHLILINGFDFNMGNKTWRYMVDKNTAFAARQGKNLVPVETNYKAYTNSCGLRRYANYGTCLAATSQLLGLGKVFFSGSPTYEYLYEDGAHPLLDPLWSTEATRVVHIGLDADRSKKVALLKRNPDALANLWVCWRDPRSNCGSCSKCIRTFVALRLNGVTNFQFTNPVRIEDVKQLAITDEHDCMFYIHFFKQAIQQGDRELARILGRIIGKYKIKTFMLDMDRYFLQGKLKGLQLKWFPSKETFVPLSIMPKFSDEHMARIAIARIRDLDLPQEEARIGSVYFHDEALDEDGVL